MNDTGQSLADASQHVAANAAQARFAALYAELHRIAHREARRHGGLAQMSTTTVLHEAYLSVAGRDDGFHDQTHFVAYAARAMRGLVIDRVRARGAQKRGGQFELVTLDDETADAVADVSGLENVSDALDELSGLDPDLAKIVDLRFFCGFSMVQIAAQLDLSERTVHRQWEKARALLYRAMTAG